MEHNKNLQLEHLINYALSKELDKDRCVIALSGNNTGNFSLQYYLDNNIPADFILHDVEDISLLADSNNQTTIALSVDFSDIGDDNTNLKNLKNHIAKKLPITEIIDLVMLALERDVLVDKSENAFVSYNGDYTSLCNSTEVFKFSIGGESNRDIVFEITFNRLFYKNTCQKSPKNKVEYASRSTQFIDILLKQIMSKHNILTVPRSSVKMDNKSVEDCLKTLYLDKNFKQSSYKSDDGTEYDTETNSIQNEIKVLIRYEDTVNATSYCEDIIDEVLVNCDLTQPKDKCLTYENSNRFKLEINETDENSDVELKTDTEDLKKNLKLIKELIETKKEKKEIFKFLRKKTDSNLYKLIAKRKPLYEASDDIVNVDISVTPIAIYCHHVVKKILKCTVTYQGENKILKDKGLCLEYSTTFNPLENAILAYTVDGQKGSPLITESNPLVIAIKNNFTESDNIDACFALRNDTVNLYDVWSKKSPLKHNFYVNENFKDAFFHKDALVYLDNNGKKCQCDSPNAMPYLKDDIVKCFFSKTYAHKTLFAHIDKEYVITSSKITSEDLINNEIYYDKTKNYTQKCSSCGTTYVALPYDWNEYVSYHTATNVAGGPDIVCCHKCYRKIHTRDKKDYFVLTNFKYGKNDPMHQNGHPMFADTPELKHTLRCPACTQNPYFTKEDVKVKGQTDYIKCDVCEQYYCKDHIDTIEKHYHVCNICNPIPRPENEFTSGHSSNRFHITPSPCSSRDDYWKKIRRKLRRKDRHENLCSIVSSVQIYNARNSLSNNNIDKVTLRSDNELRVIVTRNINKNNKIITDKRIYYFITDSDGKHYILKKISKKIPGGVL